MEGATSAAARTALGERETLKDGERRRGLQRLAENAPLGAASGADFHGPPDEPGMTGQVAGLVLPGVAGEETFAMVGRTLNQHLEGPSYRLLVPLQADAVLDGDQPVQALDLLRL